MVSREVENSWATIKLSRGVSFEQVYSCDH